MTSTSVPTSRPSGLKQFLAMSSLFIVAIGLLLFLKASYGTPDPKIHDEFSYLLAADTFAQGRLTNPSPELVEHFQSYHVLLSPTYQSKYPPGQGLSLALGIVLFGEPILGVFLTLALGIAVTVWAACATLPLRWALLSGLLLVLNPSVIAKWGLGYWGGAVALLGGALVLGGILRNSRQPNLAATIALVIGLAVLSVSRPYEGLIFSAVLLGTLFANWFHLSREGAFPSSRLSHFFVPLAVGGAIILLGNGFYNFTVTGDAALFPHQAWDQTVLAETYTGSTDPGVWGKLWRIEHFFLAPIAWLPLIAFGFLGALVRDRPTFLWFSGLLAVGILTFVSVKTSKAWPHYLAPAAPLLYVMLSTGFYSISRIRHNGLPVGLLLTLLIVSVQLVTGARGIISPAWPSTLSRHILFHAPGVKLSGVNRGDFERYLLEHWPNEQHLVLMDYLPGHTQHIEWVYNRANVVESAIIFARSLGADRDSQLKMTFPDRHHWTVEMKDYDLRICSERNGEPFCLMGEDLMP